MFGREGVDGLRLSAVESASIATVSLVLEPRINKFSVNEGRPPNMEEVDNVVFGKLFVLTSFSFPFPFPMHKDKVTCSSAVPNPGLDVFLLIPIDLTPAVLVEGRRDLSVVRLDPLNTLLLSCAETPRIAAKK